jgi:hypothetical protein
MSYLKNQCLKYSNKIPITVICDFCKNKFDILYKSAEKNYKKNNGHKCAECSGQPIRPQNTTGYWTKTRRRAIGEAVKNSESYRQSLNSRPSVVGNNNPMFGKKVSAETRAKMSKSRMGKIGTRATAWKGGKCTITKRVKGIIHGRYNWYYKVFKRDKWQCVNCGDKRKLDAHHIEPINQIIKKLCRDNKFSNDDEKVNWLIRQPEIINEDLGNGITLCRECHKKRHKNWGSHDCK